MPLSHRRRQRGGPPVGRARELGIALVEAAFVTPVFFMLIFGVVELGLAMNDNLALSHSTRAGSRVASAAGNDLYADHAILRAVLRESSALGRGQIQLVVVYQASRAGDPPSATCRGGNPDNVGNVTTGTGKCNVYRLADFGRSRDEFGCKNTPTATSLDSAWCPNTRRVTLSPTQGPAFVGVWMKVEHKWVTSWFGSTLTLTDTSVIQLEPRGRT